MDQIDPAESLRAAIRKSGRRITEVARAANVDRAQLSRFMLGDSADKPTNLSMAAWTRVASEVGIVDVVVSPADETLVGSKTVVERASATERPDLVDRLSAVIAEMSEDETMLLGGLLEGISPDQIGQANGWDHRYLKLVAELVKVRFSNLNAE